VKENFQIKLSVGNKRGEGGVMRGVREIFEIKLSVGNKRGEGGF
jgi:hypothetical protein